MKRVARTCSPQFRKFVLDFLQRQFVSLHLMGGSKTQVSQVKAEEEAKSTSVTREKQGKQMSFQRNKSRPNLEQTLNPQLPLAASTPTLPRNQEQESQLVTIAEVIRTFVAECDHCGDLQVLQEGISKQECTNKAYRPTYPRTQDNQSMQLNDFSESGVGPRSVTAAALPLTTNKRPESALSPQLTPRSNL